MAVQEEILAAGPEAADLHWQAAQLFTDWLAEEKAAAKEAEKRRLEQEAADVSTPVSSSTPSHSTMHVSHQACCFQHAFDSQVSGGSVDLARGFLKLTACYCAGDRWAHSAWV